MMDMPGDTPCFVIGRTRIWLRRGQQISAAKTAKSIHHFIKWGFNLPSEELFTFKLQGPADQTMFSILIYSLYL